MILRVVVVILLMVLALLSLTYKYGPCDQCEFNVDRFMSNYSSKCLKKPSALGVGSNIPDINISGSLVLANQEMNITR